MKIRFSSVGKSLLFCLSALFTLYASGADEPNERQSEAYQASVKQDALKTDVAAIKGELADLREEMNQLMPQDVALVDKAFKQLDSLSRNEMEKAVEALRTASRTGDLKSQMSTLAGAAKDQGTIGTSLKHMAADLQARQSVASINSKLSAILRRQIAVRNEIARLSAIETLPHKLRDRARQRLEVASGDQTGVAEDIKLVMKQIDDLAQNLPEESRAPVVKAAGVAHDAKLDESADSAVKFTQEGPFDQALVSQDAVSKTLVEMEQAMALEGKPADRLQALLDLLNTMIASQAQVTDTALKTGERRSMPDDLVRIEEGLSDQAAALRAELQVLNTHASGEMQLAQEAMEKSLKNFVRMWEERIQAQQNTQEALKQLQAAKADLEKQIADAANGPTTPQQLAAVLDSLLRDTTQAAVDQNRVALAVKTPNSPFAPTPAQKQALLDRVGELQQRALPVSPAAAQDLSNAAEQMAQATPEAQQTAAQDLAQAVKDIAQQEAALTGRTPEQMALNKAEAQLAQAAQEAAQAQQNLQNNPPNAANELNAAKQLEAAAQQTAAAAGDVPPDVAQALQEAAQDLAQAQADAAAQKTAQAQADAKAAQDAMGQAQQGMQQQAQAMAQAAAAVLPGNQAGKQNDPNAPPQENQGNGGGGSTGDFLKGAGDVGGPAQVVTGLSPHDRDAVKSLQNEKPPREFVSEVQQYYKNLADGAGL
jgi:hypothetical protein